MDEQFALKVQEKRQKQIDLINEMSAEQRALVHEYGLPIVKALMDDGVTEPKCIKHFVETVLGGFRPKRGAASSQAVRCADGE